MRTSVSSSGAPPFPWPYASPYSVPYSAVSGDVLRFPGENFSSSSSLEGAFCLEGEAGDSGKLRQIWGLSLAKEAKMQKVGEVYTHSKTDVVKK